MAAPAAEMHCVSIVHGRAAARRRRWVASAWLVLVATLIAGGALAADAGAASGLGEAKELLDTYYGGRENLRRAGELLEQAHAHDPASAAVYVQAARLAVMGGHIVGRAFRENTVEAYHALLDKALSLDPANPKAFILKAEAHNLQKNHAAEKAALDRAQALGTTDAWLWMGYGRYHRAVRDSAAAFAAFSKAEEMGPGRTSEQRKAYVASLSALADFSEPTGEPIRLKELAALAWRERHPADAWVLAGFADRFLQEGLFDDALVHGREAMRTMDHGYARRALAAALYGKAAQLIALQDGAAAEPLLAEARSLDVSPSVVLRSFDARHPLVRPLMPTLLEILTEPRAAPAERRPGLS